MVSIITPAYNCETWLRSTVESVVAQTYTDWELLLINDGSRDNTLAIMEELASGDSRIRIFSTDHVGVAAVRNLGMDEARGDCFFFLDDDDLLVAGALEYLTSVVGMDEEISVVCGGSKTFSLPAASGSATEAAEKSLLSSYERSHFPDAARDWEAGKIRVYPAATAARYSLYQTGVQASLWGKLFRRELFDGIRCTVGELYEDLDIFARLLLNGKKVAVSDRTVYLYRQRTGSIIHTFNRRRLVVLDVTRRLCEYMKSHYPDLLPAALDRRFAANFNMLQLMLRHASGLDFDPQKKIELTYGFIRSHSWPELRNPEIRFKNRLGALAALLLPRKVLFRLLRL